MTAMASIESVTLDAADPTAAHRFRTAWEATSPTPTATPMGEM